MNATISPPQNIFFSANLSYSESGSCLAKKHPVAKLCCNGVILEVVLVVIVVLGKGISGKIKIMVILLNIICYIHLKTYAYIS